MDHPLKEIGEFGLIDLIQEWFSRPSSSPESEAMSKRSKKSSETAEISDDYKQSGGRSLGIGDDCSVILRDGRHCDLVTTDLLIEESHFLIDRIAPEELGNKSLAVNLSDIAAMGGIPKNIWISIGLTQKTGIDWLERFFSGMRDLANQHNVKLLGGDTTKSRKHLIINILVTGEAMLPQIKFRSDAQPGDIIFVTGNLGDSGAGLNLLLKGNYGTDDPVEQKLIKAHNVPVAAVREGAWLGRQKSVHAMIDVSDGIASDASHIANRSGVVMNIELSSLPVSRELRQVAFRYGWDPFELACSAGEDYVLLGTCDPANWSTLKKRYHKELGSDLYHIGTVSEISPEAQKKEKPVKESDFLAGQHQVVSEKSSLSDDGGSRKFQPFQKLQSHSTPKSLCKGGEIRFLHNGNPVKSPSGGFDHFKNKE